MILITTNDFLYSTNLFGRNLPPRIIGHDCTNNAPNPLAPVSAPNKVIAGTPDVQLLLTWRDRRGHQRPRLHDIPIRRRGREASVHGLLSSVNDSDEEEGREELEKSSLLVPP